MALIQDDREINLNGLFPPFRRPLGAHPDWYKARQFAPVIIEPPYE
jgi:hypothetical protein